MPDSITIGGSSIEVKITPAGLAAVWLTDGTKATADRDPITNVVTDADTAGKVMDFTFCLPPELQVGLGRMANEVSAVVVPIDASNCRLDQTFDGADCSTLFTVNGEDLTADITIHNTTTLALGCHGFGGIPPYSKWGPFFHHARTGGYYRDLGPDTLTQNGWTNVNPTYNWTLRCGYVLFQDPAGQPWGMGLSTKGLGLHRVLCSAWAYGNFVITDMPVPVGGSVNYQVKMRFSRNLTRDHLLAHYHQDCAAEFPSQTHRDNRPWCLYQRVGPNHVTQANPYGYATAGPDYNWRLDQTVGALGLAAELGPKIVAAGCAGLMIWRMGWWPLPGEAGESQYSPDFHRTKPEAAAAIPTLTAALAAQGLKCGALARPAYVLAWGVSIATPAAGEPLPGQVVTTFDVADSPYFQAELTARFGVLTGIGMGASYVDDFLNIDTIRLLWHVRSVLGPAYQWYAEFGDDTTDAVANVYAEVAGTGGNYDLVRGGSVPISEAIAIRRRTYPQLAVLVRNRSDMTTAAFLTYCATNHLSAALDDWGGGDPTHEGLFTSPALAGQCAAAYAGLLVQTTTGWGWV